MGCGSSSLKGEEPAGAVALSSSTTTTPAAEPKPQPVKEIRHKFDSVDYDAEATQNRRNTAYAPHETARQPSSATNADRPTSSRAGPTAKLPSLSGSKKGRKADTVSPTSTSTAPDATDIGPDQQIPDPAPTVAPTEHSLEPYKSNPQL